MNRDDDALAARLRADFEHAVQDLPVATANRLRLARRAALSGRAAGAPRALRWAMPLGACAALVLGLAWWRQGTLPPAPTPAVAGSASIASPAGADALADVLPAEDDSDLYAWLAEAPVASDAGGDAL